MQGGPLGHAKLQAAHHRRHVCAMPLAVLPGVGGVEGGRRKHLRGPAAGPAIGILELLMGGADALQAGGKGGDCAWVVRGVWAATGMWFALVCRGGAVGSGGAHASVGGAVGSGEWRCSRQR